MLIEFVARAYHHKLLTQAEYPGGQKIGSIRIKRLYLLFLKLLHQYETFARLLRSVIQR